MTAPTSARFALRAATADAHDRVDRLFAETDFADRDGYAAFLAVQAAAFVPLERAIDRSAAAGALPDWPARRRSDLLLADLAALGEPAPAFVAATPPAGAAAAFGTAYVLEGSRLGGQLLVKRVPAEFPARFLSASAPGQWRTFTEALDMMVVSAGDVAEATEAALEAFALFERSALLRQQVASS